METIGSSAFQDCTALQSVTIGSEGNESACALTGIGEKAFAGCTNLSEVTIHKSEPPTAPVNAFDNYSAKLTVAKGTKADYQSSGADQAWNNFAEIVEPKSTAIGKIMTDDNERVTLTVGDGTINLSGYDGTLPVQVYTTSGINVYSGHSSRIDSLTPGIYIVTIGDKVIKTAVR